MIQKIKNFLFVFFSGVIFGILVFLRLKNKETSSLETTINSLDVDIEDQQETLNGLKIDLENITVDEWDDQMVMDFWEKEVK